MIFNFIFGIFFLYKKILFFLKFFLNFYIVLNSSGELEELSRTPGQNNIGMVAWKAKLYTPEYPQGKFQENFQENSKKNFNYKIYFLLFTNKFLQFS